MTKVTQQIQEAEQLADFTIVMPHAGIEYNLYPETSERDNYRAMIEAGADVVLGGHPHVLQPTETIEKDGLKKFIIYSMGNTMSGMGLEENGDKWKERGVMIDFTINREKPTSDVIISSLTLRPIVSLRSQNGRGGFDYHVHLAEDYLKDGKRYKKATQAMRDRMQDAYDETLELLNLKW
jgi:poly-gamma-glutamate synthesis protein (capsule biosynthesis protein)